MVWYLWFLMFIFSSLLQEDTIFFQFGQILEHLLWNLNDLHWWSVPQCYLYLSRVPGVVCLHIHMFILLQWLYFCVLYVTLSGSHMEIIKISPRQPDGFFDNRRIFGKNIHFHSCTKKVASDFKILGYTDVAGFLGSNLMKRCQEICVIFFNLVLSVCCMPSVFILLSLILSGTHTESSH